MQIQIYSYLVHQSDTFCSLGSLNRYNVGAVPISHRSQRGACRDYDCDGRTIPQQQMQPVRVQLIAARSHPISGKELEREATTKVQLSTLAAATNASTTCNRVCHK